MRISDWSSDVCSSDLRLAGVPLDDVCVHAALFQVILEALAGFLAAAPSGDHNLVVCGRRSRGQPQDGRGAHNHSAQHLDLLPSPYPVLRRRVASTIAYRTRSEEHTSELQSLIRPSYAVF